AASDLLFGRSHRIVEDNKTPLGVVQLAEISMAHGRRGNAKILAQALPKLLAFTREEEKRAIAAIVEFWENHWPANGTPELIADELGDLVRRAVIAHILPRPGHAEGVVAERLIHRCMKLVCSALRGDDDRSGAIVS